MSWKSKRYFLIVCCLTLSCTSKEASDTTEQSREAAISTEEVPDSIAVSPVVKEETIINHSKDLGYESVVNTKIQNIKIDSLSPPEFTFDNTHHDFGTLVKGESSTIRFDFENTGKSDLIIKEVYGHCSCSKPSFTMDIIPPGGRGYVNVLFNSELKTGKIFTQVVILANTFPQAANVVSIGGMVIEK